MYDANTEENPTSSLFIKQKASTKSIWNVSIFEIIDTVFYSDYMNKWTTSNLEFVFIHLFAYRYKINLSLINALVI